MRAMVLGAVLAMAACGASSTASDGGADAQVDVQRDAHSVCVPGYAVACVGPGGCAGGQACNSSGSGYEPCNCAFDGGIDDGSAGDAVVQYDAQTDVLQSDTLQTDVLQSDTLQTDTYNYTPGECNPSADTCLGAPTYPCRYCVNVFKSMCPCIPGGAPNCREGEFCCTTSCGAVCFDYATAPCR